MYALFVCSFVHSSIQMVFFHVLRPSLESIPFFDDQTARRPRNEKNMENIIPTS